MCGISGFVAFKDSSKKILIQMTDSLIHRGPDSSGYFYEHNQNNQIGLGHRRLSILDLSKNGNQPIKFEDLIIVYNGEIYNFVELKKELEKLGYKFNSNTDTEVILKSYHKWGLDAVSKFNGMFSIVIYDKKVNKIFLIRDRAGVKPLFYYYHDGLFMFSSELKAFHKHPSFKKILDKKALSLFFQHGYILEPYTIFTYAKKLRSGHYLEFEINNFSVVEKKYWDVIDCFKKKTINIEFSEVANHAEKLLKSSFKYRMVSDVPVGIFLSGGYDSSLVTTLLQSETSKKIKTFTIGFEETDFDESIFAKNISDYLGTDHHQKYCTSSDAINIFKELPFIYDEPFGDPSSIPTVLLSKFTREHVKASLSADGGDEIFGGYNKYQSVIKLLYFSKFCPSILKSFLPDIDVANFTKNINLKYYFFQNCFVKDSSISMMKALTSVFTPSEINNLVISNDKNKILSNFDVTSDLNQIQENRNKLLAADFKTYLTDNILVKVDRATMSAGLEGRDPMLDHNIIEFMAQIPSSFKFDKNNSKRIIKKIVNKYLPDDLLERPKMGFSPPLYKWLRIDFLPITNYYFSESKLKRQKILDVNYVTKLYKDFLSGRKDCYFKLWLVLIFLSWHEQWVESPN